MVILFLLAVLFAIPTFGLSLLAFFGLVVAKRYIELQPQYDAFEARHALAGSTGPTIPQSPTPRGHEAKEAGLPTASALTNKPSTGPEATGNGPTNTKSWHPQAIEELAMRSFRQEGAPQLACDIADSNVEIFFSFYLPLLNVTPIEHKEEFITGRAGWLSIRGDYYLIAAVYAEGYAVVSTFTQALPFVAAATIRGDIDVARFERGQREWLTTLCAGVRDNLAAAERADPYQ